MILAMHKKMRIGCEQLIQEAIQFSPVSTISNYIKRNYMKNTHQWTLWTCQYSSFLLQVTFTNALESYYSELKRLTCHKHELIGKWIHSFFCYLFY